VRTAVLVVDFGATNIDGEAFLRGLCGNGDDSQAPVLRLVRKLAPELLSLNHAEEKSAQKP
jgi:hypothetical protein